MYVKNLLKRTNFILVWELYICRRCKSILKQGGIEMARNKNRSVPQKNEAYVTSSKQAENNLAASTNENRNQKGHIPNSPSTG